MDDLKLLLAERDIKNVVLRYCRGVDRMDLALVRSCYHPDAEDHHGDFAGGLDEALDWVWEVLATYSSTVHLVGNMLVEFDPASPGWARCESYGMALHSDGGEGGSPGPGHRVPLDRRSRATGAAGRCRRMALLAPRGHDRVDPPLRAR